MFKIKTENVNDRYKEIIVKPNDIDSSKDMGVYSFPSKVDLKDTIFKNSILTVSSYEMKDSFKEEYEYYINNELKKGIQTIFPETTNRGESKIIKIKTNLEVDETSIVSKYIKNAGDLFDKYGLISYRYQGSYKTVKLTKIKVDYQADNFAYMQIPKEVENANKASLILRIRGVKYTFPLEI